MNKTLYVKDADIPIWEEAEKLAPNGLSGLVQSLLEGYVTANKPPDAEGFKRIEVETRKNEDGPAIKKAFVGRWLCNELEPEPDYSGVSWGPQTYSVAQTKKGALAVYEEARDGTAELEVWDSFDDLKDATIDNGRYPRYPENVVAAVATELGQPYTIDLDI